MFELVFAVVCLTLGVLLVALRERLGAQARAEGHGVTPLAYAVIGAILLASGAITLLAAVG